MGLVTGSISPSGAKRLSSCCAAVTKGHNGATSRPRGSWHENWRLKPMPLETRVFDPARYLDSDEARAAYMTEALETGDPVFIGDALGVIARARGLNRVAREAGLSGDELDHTLSSD